MKKVKVSFKGGVVRYFEIGKINIITTLPNKGPSFIDFRRLSGDKYILNSTNDIIPDVEFLEKIEIVDE